MHTNGSIFYISLQFINDFTPVRLSRQVILNFPGSWRAREGKTKQKFLDLMAMWFSILIPYSEFCHYYHKWIEKIKRERVTAVVFNIKARIITFLNNPFCSSLRPFVGLGQACQKPSLSCMTKARKKKAPSNSNIDVDFILTLPKADSPLGPRVCKLVFKIMSVDIY